MLIIVIALITIIASLTVLVSDNTTSAEDEYCNLECRERRLKKHNFCC